MSVGWSNSFLPEAGLAAGSKRSQQFSVQIEFVHLVQPGVGHVDLIVEYPQLVLRFDDALSPGTQELAVGSENNDRVFVAGRRIHSPAAVDVDPIRADQRHILGQFGPTDDRLVVETQRRFSICRLQLPGDKTAHPAGRRGTQSTAPQKFPAAVFTNIRVLVFHQSYPSNGGGVKQMLYRNCPQNVTDMSSERIDAKAVSLLDRIVDIRP